MLMQLLIKYIKFYQVFDLQVPQTFFGILNKQLSSRYSYTWCYAYFCIAKHWYLSKIIDIQSRQVVSE